MTAQVEFAGPNWAPILACLPERELDNWMWMSRVHVDGRVIEQYKHQDTRRYLNIDTDGQAVSVQYDGKGETPTIHNVVLADAYRTAAGNFAGPLR